MDIDKPCNANQQCTSNVTSVFAVTQVNVLVTQRVVPPDEVRSVGEISLKRSESRLKTESASQVAEQKTFVNKRIL